MPAQRAVLSSIFIMFISSPTAARSCSSLLTSLLSTSTAFIVVPGWSILSSVNCTSAQSPVQETLQPLMFCKTAVQQPDLLGEQKVTSCILSNCQRLVQSSYLFWQSTAEGPGNTATPLLDIFQIFFSLADFLGLNPAFLLFLSLCQETFCSCHLLEG